MLSGASDNGRCLGIAASHCHKDPRPLLNDDNARKSEGIHLESGRRASFPSGSRSSKTFPPIA
jgi:hypothetical protein